MKLAFVINGCGGVGKDTLCNIAAKYFRVRNISSITPVKEVATRCGWNGEKTDKARKFLSDLKNLMIDFNDYPLNWLKGQYQAFLDSEDEILFVHIREPQEIAKFVAMTEGNAKTLLIRGGARMKRREGNYGNTADDDVEKYKYDYYFENDKSLREIDPLFKQFLLQIAEGQFHLNS